jgi:thymidylate synthase ThyX
LDYISKTIRSSWEFVDYTFQITGVTRAFTHQFVRTRTGSYAQQSQRSVDMSSGIEVRMPNSVLAAGKEPSWTRVVNTIEQLVRRASRGGCADRRLPGYAPDEYHD